MLRWRRCVVAEGQLSPLHSYFAVVTIGTVGYGDIHASTQEGYAWVTFVIVFSFIVVPMQASRLIALVESRPKYAGRFVVSPIPHVVVLGRLGERRVCGFAFARTELEGCRPQVPKRLRNSLLSSAT